MMDGILPVAYALDDEDEIEEEHRLFYVGITRAKNRLFLSLHHEGTRGGITQFNKISRFLDVSNVYTKFEHTGIGRERMKPTVRMGTEAKPSSYDKEWLIRRVMDFLK
jgi:DNA helicase-2/ATP-dependent DNA helicase PcrA